MSLPSSTTSLSDAILRCIATKNSRTAGILDTSDAALEIACSRIAVDTSSPLSMMLRSGVSENESSISSKSGTTAPSSSGETPLRTTYSATALYIAPVSR